jgi:hypothetical protein
MHRLVAARYGHRDDHLDRLADMLFEELDCSSKFISVH